MFIFQVRNIKLLLLCYLILFKTVSVFYLTREHEHLYNYTYEEYIAVINVAEEGWNSTLMDNMDNSTMGYDTVVVRVASPFDVYFTPCLIILGIGGNMLTLYVFFSSKLRHLSTSQYLSALAVSDSLFLSELFPPWLSTIDINGVFHRDAYCKGFVYISYVACCLSAWLVIAFTVERFVAVQFPLQRPSVCTVRRARYVIVALTVASMLVNLPVLHFAGTENEQCNIDPEKLEQAAKFNWVDTTVTFTIPLILIIFFNTWIAAVVYKLERNRIKLTQEELRTSVPGHHGSRDNDFVYLRSQRRITKMLLIVSTIFVLFNCPAYTLRICGYAHDMDSEFDDKWLTAQNVATMMFNSNFGINFFLYCLTGQNFRRALVQTVPCFGWLGRKINGLFNRSTVNHARNFSVTTSAASIGTDATVAEPSSFKRPRWRRAPRPPGRCIMRWTFDNSKQRRGPAVSATSESIYMQDLTPRPGPSRLLYADYPQPVTSRLLHADHSQPGTSRLLHADRPEPGTSRLLHADRPEPGTSRLLHADHPQPGTSRLLHADHPQPGTSRLLHADRPEPGTSRLLHADHPQPGTSRLLHANHPLPGTSRLLHADRPEPGTSRLLHADHPQPGKSRLLHADRPQPRTSRSFTTVHTQAIIETRNPNDELKRAALTPRSLAVVPSRRPVESTSPVIRPWRPSDDPRISTINQRQPEAATEPSSPSIEYWEPVTDRRTVTASRRPLVVSRNANLNLRRYTIESRRSTIESSRSTLELMRPTVETPRAVLTHAKPVRPKRKSCCF